jgi:hypothetical protein
LPTPRSKRDLAALAVVIAATACSRDSDSGFPPLASDPSRTTTTVVVEDSAPTVVAAGDIACPVGQAATLTECQFEATARTVESLQPDVVLALGDLQYERGEKANFEQVYGPSWGRFKNITKPVPGEREWMNGKVAGYRNYFPSFVNVAERRTWYSFDIGTWHVVALDSNCRKVEGCGKGSPQETWLRADLAAHPAECILAFMHRPRWSSGSHGSAVALAPLWDALAEAGADVLLGAHDYHYERFKPDGGIRQFVVGTGGRSLAPLVRFERGSQRLDASSFGVLALKLGTTGYSWTFVPSVGEFTDDGMTSC